MLPLAARDVIQKVDEAFYWIAGISVFFIVGITGAMLYFLWRYRRSRHPEAAQIAGNMKLEVTWIVIPTLIVLFMFWKGYEGFALMRRPPENAKVVEVEAYQWRWVFRYPETGISTPGPLVVPVDTPVKLELRAPTTPEAPNVIHSFYLPDFKVKEDCVPGRTNTMWFEADREGEYNIFCAEYCGSGHATMNATLEVRSREGFEAWMARQVALRNKPVTVDEAMDARTIEDVLDPKDPEAPPVEGYPQAESLYQTNCKQCHGAEGLGGIVEGARNFRVLDGWKNGPKVTEIFKTLTEGLAGTRMVSYANLTPWQRLALAHRVTRFIDAPDRPRSTREDFEAMVRAYELDQERPARLTDEDWRTRRDEIKRRAAAEAER